MVNMNGVLLILPLKKYNMPLCDEFIEYFINHCKLGGVGGQ